MNNVKINFPERYQANAFCVWLESQGYELYQKYYADKLPEERQPHNIDIEYDESQGKITHHIMIN